MDVTFYVFFVILHGRMSMRRGNVDEKNVIGWGIIDNYLYLCRQKELKN